MNKQKFLTIFSKTLLGIIFITGSVVAAEGEEKTEQKHIGVGEREMKHIERVQLQEKRAYLARRAEGETAISDEEEVELSPEELQELTLLSDGEEDQVPDAPYNLVKKGVNATTYYTTHEGAFHNPLAVSLLGDTVELEDGSIWAVNSSDRYKTLDWMTGDTIIVTPNHSWFSSYDYCFININTGVHVKVNLSLGPIYNGIFTHWILAIDYGHREICLEDGSVWEISTFDGSVVDNWLPNDTVIIGINDGWFTGGNPNILINVNMNNYAMGKCIF
ncbi:MAG: hypothetical protein K940chlam7_01960 [Chlamydiae bacterium]|nr:hypothetical protein [Chlamydiota bacterium]